MNILAAISTLVSQKVDIQTIISTMDSVWGIPGRLEEVPNRRWAKRYLLIMHIQKSPSNQYSKLFERWDGVKRIITLFGATGDRDKIKRPKMWRIVDILSDVVILTDDDTYTEDSLSIIRDVSVGIKKRKKFLDYPWPWWCYPYGYIDAQKMRCSSCCRERRWDGSSSSIWIKTKMERSTSDRKDSRWDRKSGDGIVLYKVHTIFSEFFRI